MKSIVQLIIGLALTIPVFAKEEASSFVGSYFHRSRPGETFSLDITLDLRADGSYQATRSYCMVYGTAEGRWTIKDDKLVLSPTSETGMLENYLKIFVVRRDSQGVALLPEVEVPALHPKKESLTRR